MAKLHPIKAVLLAMKVAVLLSSLFLCGSCTTSQRETPPVLLQAEALLQSHPDSAYALLLPIDPSTLDSIDWAHYYYLYTAAANKLGQHISWHKEMQRAADIYAPILEEEDSKARVYYYAALAHQENKRYAVATSYYFKSLINTDPYVPSRLTQFIYEGLYKCYYEQDIYEDASDYVCKALSIAQILGDSASMKDLLIDKAFVLMTLELHDSTLTTIQEYERIFPNKLDYRYHSTYSTLFRKFKRYKEALLHNDSALMKIPPHVNREPLYMSRANLFSAIRQLDSATHYNKLALIHPDIFRKYYVYKSLYDLGRETNTDEKTLVCYIDSMMHYGNLMEQQEEKVKIKNIETSYILENQNAKFKVQLLFGTTIITIVLLMMASLFGFKYYKQYRRILEYQKESYKLKRQIQEWKQTQQTLATAQQGKDSNDEQLIKLLQRQIQNSFDLFRLTDNYKNICSAYNDSGKNRNYDISELDKIVIESFSEVIMTMENNGQPSISKSDYLYCFMCYMGFDGKPLANYWRISYDSLRKRKSRIKEKISSDLFLIFFKNL